MLADGDSEGFMMLLRILSGWRMAACLCMALAAGCAGAPQKQEPAGPPPQVFYPAPPDPPRIQHLTTFQGEKDFAAKRSSFADFIAGEERGRALVTTYGVALADNRLYVTDSKLGTVAIFDLARQQFSMFSGVGTGRMKLPINITIDRDGTKYITDTARNEILRYDRGNAYLGAFGAKDQFRPVDVAIAGQRLYVVDVMHNEVQVLDKISGKLLFKFGQAGEKEDKLYLPTNLTIAANGDVLVADTGNFRVKRFSAEGRPLGAFGEVGDTPGTFARPKGIAVDRAGRIYVGDAAFQNVQLFDTDGKLLLTFGQPEHGSALSLPAAVKIDYDNVGLFKQYAKPGFEIEYLIMVASQVSPNKVDVFGFGRMAGADYSRDEKPAAK